LEVTDGCNPYDPKFSMNVATHPFVIASDRIDRGVHIEFADGRSAMYSSSLLYEILPRAEQLNHTEPDEPFPSNTRASRSPHLASVE